jgi:hypothetical protein
MCLISFAESWQVEQAAVMGDFTSVVGLASQGAVSEHTHGAVVEQAVPLNVPVVMLLVV